MSASLGLCYGQKKATTIATPKKVTTIENDSVLLDYLDGFRMQLREPRYKLYPTENNWIFLKLDTMLGGIWMVQYSVNSGERVEVELDAVTKLLSFDDPICGRFELYPTKNMYNFILLDNINGYCWQVQWSVDKDKRMVLPIY